MYILSTESEDLKGSTSSLQHESRDTQNNGPCYGCPNHGLGRALLRMTPAQKDVRITDMKTSHAYD